MRERLFDALDSPPGLRLKGAKAHCCVFVTTWHTKPFFIHLFSSIFSSACISFIHTHKRVQRAVSLPSDPFKLSLRPRSACYYCIDFNWPTSLSDDYIFLCEHCDAHKLFFFLVCLASTSQLRAALALTRKGFHTIKCKQLRQLSVLLFQPRVHPSLFSRLLEPDMES